MIDARRMQAILEKSRSAPCVGALGLDLLEFDEGYCKLLARHDPRFDGVLPGFHGGMLANVADCVAWFAIVTQTGPDEVLLTTDLALRYLNPCMTDAIAVGHVIKLGRTLCPVQIEITDTNGQPVATGQVCYIRVSNLGK